MCLDSPPAIMKTAWLVLFFASAASTAFGQVGPFQETLTSLQPQSHAAFGSTLAAGDIDGDGFLDLLVAEPCADLGAVTGAGRVWAFQAPPHPSSALSLSRSAPQAAEHFGASLAVGDLDGDGKDDVVVGSPDRDVSGLPDVGEVAIHYAASIANEGLTIAPSNLDAMGFFGYSIAVGDIDADGFPDVVIGAPEASVGTSPCAGRVTIHYGPSFTAVVRLTGIPTASAMLGTSLAVADIDGDGAVDILAGAPAQGGVSCGPAQLGLVHLFRGPSPLPLPSFTYSPPGLQNASHFGASLSVGDLDADGLEDLAIGAPALDLGASLADAGGVFVYEGFGLVSGILPPNPQASGAFGSSVSIGQLRWTGSSPDLTVGEPGAWLGGAPSVGQAHVFDGANLFQIAGVANPCPDAGARFGAATLLADLNRDGIADLVTGAAGADPGSPCTAATQAVGGGVVAVQLQQFDLGVDNTGISVSQGDSVALQLDAGPGNGQRTYVLFSSLTPGVSHTGGAILPFIPDAWTFFVLQGMSAPNFSGFAGVLDPLGRAGAVFDLAGANNYPALVGTRFLFGYVLLFPFDYASRPVVVQALP